MPFRGTYYPLGFPVAIETNSQQILNAAAESWDLFQQAFVEPPVKIRVALAEDGAMERPPEPRFRAQEHLLSIVSDHANFAVCDYRSRFAFCWLTPGAVADPGWLRFYFLEAMVYTTLTQLYLTPVHAACVARDGRGVLLCGGPGAGKSCLAFACARRGWTFVSDDSSSLVRRKPGRVVLGRPHQMRFRDNAAGVLPELKGRRATHERNNKTSVEVCTADWPEIQTAVECRIDHVVFLRRKDSGAAKLTTVDAEEALRRILELTALYAPEVREEQEASLRNLLEVSAFELHYSDLGAAVEQLENLMKPAGPAASDTLTRSVTVLPGDRAACGGSHRPPNRS